MQHDLLVLLVWFVPSKIAVSRFGCEDIMKKFSTITVFVGGPLGREQVIGAGSLGLTPGETVRVDETHTSGWIQGTPAGILLLCDPAGPEDPTNRRTPTRCAPWDPGPPNLKLNKPVFSKISKTQVSSVTSDRPD